MEQRAPVLLAVVEIVVGPVWLTLARHTLQSFVEGVVVERSTVIETQKEKSHEHSEEGSVLE